MNIKRLPQQGVPALTSAFIEGKGELIVQIDRQQYLYGLIVKFLGRLTTAGGAGAAVNAEAPQSIFNRIKVNTNSSLYGSKLPINLPGATIFQRAHIFSGTPPVASGGLATANAAYDIEVDWPILFVLENTADDVQRATLLPAPLLSSLQLEMQFNPGAALITSGGATTYAWTAYGSAAGVPEVLVQLLQVNGLQNNPKTVLVTKTDQYADLSKSVGSDQQVGNEIPIGSTIARVVLKQYVQDPLQAVDVAATMLSPKTAASAGWASPQLQFNRVPIRQYQRWAQLESENKNHYSIGAWPSGYGVIDFGEGSNYGSPVGQVTNYLMTQSLAVKKGLLTTSGVVNASANSQLEVGVDQVYPIPAGK
jgi:hypothetical protein